MATIQQIREAIGERLLTLDGMRVAQEWSDPINVSGNALVAVVEYAGASYDDVFNDQGHAILFGIVVLASKSGPDDRSGKDKIDSLNDPTPGSTTCLRRPVNGNLGGIVASATVRSSSEYKEYTPGDVPYLGCEYVVAVMT